ncbi:MAG: sugar ABC transporter substrate-binding protein, partial [Firmicutes bacterium]|nr:sugar ABC transporter substrate-binding protein [Bacillota bacterium]
MKKCVSLLLALVMIMALAIYANAATTLNYLEVLTSPERTALLKETIAEYEARNPGIKINLISPPYEQADQKATLMLNTNQALDIIEIRDYTVKQFVNNKRLTDLTEHFRDWQDAKTLTAVAKTAARTVDNIPYLVPQCIFIKALFVRTDVLAANGIDYAPKTFSELVEISRQITDPSKNQYGFAWRGKSAEIKFADLFASAYVRDMVGAEFIYSEEESFFTSSGWKVGMETYLALFEDGVPKDGINWGFNEQINGFVSGATPFLIQDPDAIPLIDKLLGPDKYEVVPTPVGPFGVTFLDYGFSGLGIPSYSKNKEQAWDF